jgi:predicted nucleic acid-binding protein
LGPFDAVLAAAAESAGAVALVSADPGFAELGTLRHVVPDASGVKSLLPEAAAT